MSIIVVDCMELFYCPESLMLVVPLGQFEAHELNCDKINAGWYCENPHGVFVIDLSMI